MFASVSPIQHLGDVGLDQFFLRGSQSCLKLKRPAFLQHGLVFLLPMGLHGLDHCEIFRQCTLRTRTSSSFLDLSTLYFVWDVINEDTTNPLQFLTAIPHCCFTRATLRVSSTLVEDICFFSKAEELFSRFMPLDKRRNAANLGFGHLSSASYQGDDLICLLYTSPSPRDS